MVLFRYFVATLPVLMCVSSLHCQTLPQSAGTLSLDNAVETLQQDFRGPPVWRRGAVQVNEKTKPLSDPSFSWAAGYIWSHPPIGAADGWPRPTKDFPAWTSNGAADTDPNGDMIAQVGELRSPLTWSRTLNVTARKMPDDLAATINRPDPRDYISGTITSFPYAQLYGVFAISAKLPKGKGLWPAFWLLPSDKSWPPELDIMEVIGREPNTLYTTLHVANGRAYALGTKTQTDLSAGFHEYAVDWGPDKIDWYFDRKLVFSQPTPSELRKPCYVLANLSVGRANSWGGEPDGATHFPATMQIAYIRVWQRPSYLELKNSDTRK